MVFEGIMKCILDVHVTAVEPVYASAKVLIVLMGDVIWVAVIMMALVEFWPLAYLSFHTLVEGEVLGPNGLKISGFLPVFLQI